METTRKRYCPCCGERIRRTTRRCHHCGKLTPSRKDYLVVSLLAGVAVVVLLKYAGVF
jgi:predicted amidophosphoribosyltransferase